VLIERDLDVVVDQQDSITVMGRERLGLRLH
jgi:hypothetical protein